MQRWQAQRILPWVSLGAIFALLIVQVVLGRAAHDITATGMVLLIDVSQVMSLSARRHSTAWPLMAPALALRLGLFANLAWLLVFGVFERPVSPWLEGAIVISTLLTMAAYVYTYRMERRRPLTVDTLSIPEWMPAEIARTYEQVLRGQPVDPDARGKLDRWVNRKPGVFWPFRRN